MTEKTLRPEVAPGTELLDETDPYAGDDLDWADEPDAEPSPLGLWRGIALGLALSAVAWAVLTAIAATVYVLSTR